MMPTPTALSTSVINSDHAKGRKATDLFRDAYDKAGLNEETAQRVNENQDFPAALLRLIIELSSAQIIRETQLLKPEEPITFPARDKLLDPKKFFNSRGVYLWGSRERLLPALKPVTSTPKRVYGVARLKKNANDSEILRDLPKRHLSNWEDIASLIEMYPKGKEGYFLFYLEGVDREVFAARVSWNADDRGWYILVWGLEERGFWYAISHVVCPAT